MSSREVIEVDVVVVGAGISGLTSAWHLLRKDPSLKVVVLEAKDRVGGRTLTADLNTGNPERKLDAWDLGGQWVGRCQPHIMVLLETLGIETYPQYIDGKKVMQLGSDRVKTYSSAIPSLSVFSLLDLYRYMTKVEQMRSEVDAASPYSCPNAVEWDAMTLDTFNRKTVWTKGARDCIDSATRAMLGVEASQISMLYYLTYASAAGGLKYLTEATEYTAQEYRIKGGSQQISRKLVNHIGEKNVHLKHPVYSISQMEESVEVTTCDGATFACKRVIMATPPSQTGRIRFDPLLPSSKQEIIKRMPVSNMIKIIVTYSTAFWRQVGHSGEAVTNGGPTKVSGCDSGPLCVAFDGTSCNNSPALVAFIAGVHAVQWREQEDEERKAAVLNSLAEFFGPEAFNFATYIEQDWSLEPYSEGGPVYCVAPGAMRYFASGLRDPFDKIYFAGTESATVWCGYMSGAVQAGLRAATEVLYDLRPQVVTKEDLAMLGQSLGSKTKASSNSKTAKRLVKWTVGLGSVVVLVLAVKRAYFTGSDSI